jgi:hypothetical protein
MRVRRHDTIVGVVRVCVLYIDTPQAASMNTVVSSESALVITTPTIPSGSDWRAEEASIIVIASALNVKRKEREYSQELVGVGNLAVPIDGPGEPTWCKNAKDTVAV